MFAFLINNLRHIETFIGNCKHSTGHLQRRVVVIMVTLWQHSVSRIYFDLLITLMWFVIIISRSRRRESGAIDSHDRWDINLFFPSLSIFFYHTHSLYMLCSPCIYIHIACAKQDFSLSNSWLEKALINISYFCFPF